MERGRSNDSLIHTYRIAHQNEGGVMGRRRKLEGLRILITGASQGIGRALAVAAARAAGARGLGGGALGQPAGGTEP